MLNEQDKNLMQDLNLAVIFETMAGDDTYLYNTVRDVILNSLTDRSIIAYRQDVLRDLIQKKSIAASISSLYKLASTTLSMAAIFREYARPSFARIIPVSVRVMNAVNLLELLTNKLEELISLIDLNERHFRSEGMTAFCKRLRTIVTDEFLTAVKKHITELKSIAEGGRMVIGSGIGLGMKGARHILRKVSGDSEKANGRIKLFHSSTGCEVPLDNTNLSMSAREIEDAGLIQILRFLNAVNSNLLDFFEALRFEAGFYFGCANLYAAITGLHANLSYPVLEDRDSRDLIFNGLYDLSLFLNEKQTPVSNDLQAEDKTLFVITGANQGGKSTYLRSIGIAQLLMQCGMFVPAAFYRANVSSRIFTHFTREEDAGMSSGKLDEELSRMDGIIREITKDSLVLMNEPFASTMEREGSKIAADIVRALLESSIKVIFVTHLFDFAENMYRKGFDRAVFLRAEREDDGSRSFRIRLGEPLPTSYGEDLFKSVVGRTINLAIF
jgi:hypothetical protein